MNKRIEELADKVMNDAEGGLNFQQFYEKFAELIVQECCQKLENDGMVEVAMEMKEHFGVE